MFKFGISARTHFIFVALSVDNKNLANVQELSNKNISMLLICLVFTIILSNSLAQAISSPDEPDSWNIFVIYVVLYCKDGKYNISYRCNICNFSILAMFIVLSSSFIASSISARVQNDYTADQLNASDVDQKDIQLQLTNLSLRSRWQLNDSC